MPRLIPRHLFPIAAIVALVMTQPVRANAFTVEQWSLSTRVETSGNYDQHSNFTIMNPFDGVLESRISPSFARAHFAWSWLAESGQFNTDITQNALDSSPGYDTEITTRVRVMTLADVTLRSQGLYTYNLPPEDLTIDVEVTYRDLGLSNPEIMLSGFFDESFFGGVAATETFDNQALLPAGRRFDIIVISRLRSSGGGSNSIGTGAGFVNLSLTAVPEPSTAVAMIIGVLTLARGRRGRLGRSMTRSP